MPANGLTFTTDVPSGTSGDTATDTFTITDNSGTLASGVGAPGVLGVGATYIDNLDSSSISPLVSVADTVDYLIAPAVNVTFDGGLAGVLATQNFFVGGTLTFTDTAVGVVNNVNINVYGGELTSNSGTLASALSGSHVTVADGGQVNGSGNNLINALDGATIAFSTDGGGTISADATSSGAVINLLSSSTVTGFSTGADKIDFTSATGNTVDSYTISSSGGNSTMSFYSGLHGTGTLLGEATVQTTSQLTDGTYSVGQSGPLTITQDTVGTGFTVGAATSTLVCYVTGTRILTVRGEVAVEDLAVGDLAVTASGEQRPIRWIGSKRVEQPVRSQQPVRVMAGAFGEGLPARDLHLSPGHAVCVSVMDEVFVPVSELVNGATVALVDVPEVTYWHVELESHDVLMAEGLGCESYMDAGNRAFFGREYGRLRAVDPDRVAESLEAYARPFVDHGPIVEAIRQRLTARAETLGWARGSDIDLHLLVDGRRIEPTIDGDLARFIFPAEAKSAVLVSHRFSPAWMGETLDRRELGVMVKAIDISDGLRVDRRITPDDPIFGEGFYHLERKGEAAHRWTNGQADLPAHLWEGGKDQIVLRLTFDPACGWAWVSPQVPLAVSLVRAA